jgi:hypothetical protein
MSTEMHTRFANILLILFFSYMPVFGQTNDSILVKAVEENLYQFKVENGVFTGSGANVIKEIIPGSQFLLVGEQHGISEPALFTETLFQEAIQFKYSYLAIETDPFVAKKLESTIRESQEAVFEFLKTYPGSVPFYATQEDLKLVQTAVSLSAANESVLWGVDQVFLGAPRLLFSRLSEMAPDPNARQMAEEYYEKAQSAFVKFAETGNPGNLMMVQLTEDDFQNLYDAFGTDSSRETFKMINGLKESQQIYSLWMQGNHYENNYTPYIRTFSGRIWMERLCPSWITGEIFTILFVHNSGIPMGYMALATISGSKRSYRHVLCYPCLVFYFDGNVC